MALPDKFPPYLYAWIGEDELGSGEVGVKQGWCPAGYIPAVSIDEQKARRFAEGFQHQAANYGKRIYLVRFAVEAILDYTAAGEPL